MNSLALKSPAKVNLYLEVLGKRPDGYHELRTLFHRISLCDELILRRIPESKLLLECNHPKLKRVQENIIYKAWKLLSQAVHLTDGVRVTLRKKIPVAAGLGGGSSNAAHFLLGMNRLFNLELPRVTLLRLAEQIGSDVPFFIEDTREALGLGRGEFIIPVSAAKNYWFVLVFPPFGLATREVYERLHAPKLTGLKPTVRIARYFSDCEKPNVSLKLGRNDLFKASAAMRPELKDLIAFIRQLGSKRVFMSGSGPTIVSLHAQKSEAKRLLKSIQRIKPDLHALICKSY